MKEYIFTIDIGTSSCRCAVYLGYQPLSNINNNNVKYGESIHMVQIPVAKSNIGTFDPEEIVDSVDFCVDQCLKYLREKHASSSNPFKVKAVGFDCFAMSLVGCQISISKGLRAVTPVYTYANDHPKKKQYTNKLKRIIEKHPKKELISSWLLHQQTGTTIHASYAASQLLCLQKEEPEIFRKVQRWTTLTTYVISKWTGDSNVKVGISEASWTGLFDRTSVTSKTLQWHEGLLQLIGMNSNNFSKIGDSYWEITNHGGNNWMKNEIATEKLSFSKKCKKYSEKWPEFYNGIKIFLGVGDGAAANIGSKATNGKRVAMTIGTSAAMRIVINDIQFQGAAIPDGLWCYKINRSFSLLGGALTDGGSIHEWLHNTLQLGKRSDENNDNLIQYINQDKDRLFQHNLTILPFPNGERAPGWVDDATSTVTGIKMTTTPQDIMIAHLQATSFRLKEIYDRLKEYLNGEGDEIKIICSGTALQNNNLWKTILADTLGTDLISENIKEATSRGVYQLIQCTNNNSNVFQSPEFIDQHATVYKANLEHYKKYAGLKAKQDVLYNQFYGKRDSYVVDCSGECAFCLDDLYQTDECLIETTMINHCKHVFHSKCLNEWKNEHGGTTCPICRQQFAIRRNIDNRPNPQQNTTWTPVISYDQNSSFLIAAAAVGALSATYLLNNH
jgi:gluconokinase